MAGSLYIHIPFCAGKCPYCDFYSLSFDKETAGQYVDALCRELHMLATGSDEPLRTLFIGGGTPTTLPPALLETLAEGIARNFSFAPDMEFSVEANPGTLEPETLRVLQAMGVNRMSLGVQSFDQRELSMLGRRHDVEDALRAAGMIAQSGMALSLDLMYGLPGQHVADLEESITRALSFSPRHLSLYELTPEAGTPLAEMLRDGFLILPDEDTVAGMFMLIHERLSGAEGFEHYEVSNYARAGGRCRHNMTYWQRRDYLGAGAGAHSLLDGRRRVANARDLQGYIRALQSGQSAPAEHYELSDDEVLRERVFLALRTVDGVDMGGRDEELREELEGEIQEGLLEVRDGRLAVTVQGWLVLNPLTRRVLEAMNI